MCFSRDFTRPSAEDDHGSVVHRGEKACGLVSKKQHPSLLLLWKSLWALRTTSGYGSLLLRINRNIQKKTAGVAVVKFFIPPCRMAQRQTGWLGSAPVSSSGFGQTWRSGMSTRWTARLLKRVQLTRILSVLVEWCNLSNKEMRSCLFYFILDSHNPQYMSR